ncbi:hypothetical protein AB0B48_31395 [Micromonospora sp. NPDC049089]|uniref:hypothetical protein n=1 Tax=unclassified Micromonospora TaxID=2617518 RepID=UPI0033ED363F
MARPVALRSCHDPNPDWRTQPVAADRPNCRRPLLVLEMEDGDLVEVAGLLLWWHAARLVHPARWFPALRLAFRVARLMATRQRPPRRPGHPGWISGT